MIFSEADCLELMCFDSSIIFINVSSSSISLMARFLISSSLAIVAIFPRVSLISSFSDFEMILFKAFLATIKSLSDVATYAKSSRELIYLTASLLTKLSSSC